MKYLQENFSFAWSLLLVECDATQFECLDKECIPAEFRCDGRKHCADGSDEVRCNSKYWVLLSIAIITVPLD